MGKTGKNTQRVRELPILQGVRGDGRMSGVPSDLQCRDHHIPRPTQIDEENKGCVASIMHHLTNDV